jgi:hypothetical protein
MSEYDNNLRGALFKNNKRTKDTQPEYTGNCEINGTEFWVSAWIRESKNGEKFFSMAYTPKETQPVTSNVTNVTPDVTTVNDSIPF